MRAYTGAHHGAASTSIDGSSNGSRSSAISGSDRIASPTHDGATIRMRSRAMTTLARAARASRVNAQATPSVAAGERAAFEPVARAAIRAHHVAGLGDVEKHARMRAPQRHRRIGTEHRQVLGGFTLTAVDGSGTSLTPSSASRCFDGLRPLTVSKNSFCSFAVIGPRVPSPIGAMSYSRIGVTSAAVPVKNASSAM